MLKHEYNVAKDLNSPRIIKVVEFREEGGTSFLVLELFSELNMKQALRRGPESLAFMLDKIVDRREMKTTLSTLIKMFGAHLKKEAANG